MLLQWLVIDNSYLPWSCHHMGMGDTAKVLEVYKMPAVSPMPSHCYNLRMKLRSRESIIFTDLFLYSVCLLATNVCCHKI
jgi:hypothetical protein